LNKLQQSIYNNGERLVPYVSHDDSELVRHRSSYAFFHSVIASDIESNLPDGNGVSVADLGFGSGYGCALLSSLKACSITGIDISEECEVFARMYFPRSNVNYRIEDLTTFVPRADIFDYVVSRGVLEHVPNGIGLINSIRFRHRVMIDVPYDEPSGNEHHIVTGIKEVAFAQLGDCEFFYEDLEGRIFDAAHKPDKPNMIMVVISSPKLPSVGSLFQFPLAPVRDKTLEVAGQINATGSRNYFKTPGDLLSAVERAVKETEVVVDIGCGIVPMNYFRPSLHFMVEPWREYSDILSYRYAGDKSVIIIRARALETLQQLGVNSVDSIFLLDVIEHLEKNVGLEVIKECERVAREQIVIFTPFGYMAQQVEEGQMDGWGLGGSTVQEHRSGWEPEDFDATWTFYICQDFHNTNFKGTALSRAHGAFYAIRNFDNKITVKPESLSDIRRPLPSELELENLRKEYQVLSLKLQSLLNFPAIAFALTLRRISRKLMRALLNVR
jgi:2-polyprenyl-3-methyl-5-hydroxy-6-metoxy-1,4-benzoquinol methylase